MTSTKSVFSILATLTVIAAMPTTSAASDPASTIVRDQRTSRIEVRDHRTTDREIRDHRTVTNEVVIVGQGSLSCVAGTHQLIRSGLPFVTAYDCEGALYHYTASDGSSVFLATMSSHTGELNVEFAGLLN